VNLDRCVGGGRHASVHARVVGVCTAALCSGHRCVGAGFSLVACCACDFFAALFSLEQTHISISHCYTLVNLGVQTHYFH
jgi:hypothetical protein